MDSRLLPYIVTEAFCIVYTLTILFSMRSEVGSGREMGVLKKLIIAYAVVIAADMPIVIIENGQVQGWQTLDTLMNGICMSAVDVSCYLWFIFVELRLKSAFDPQGSRKWLLRAPMITMCILNMSLVLDGWMFFSIDSEIIFLMQRVVTFSYLLVSTAHATICIGKTKQRKKKIEYFSFLLSVGIGICAVMLESKIPTVPIFALCVLAALQMLFLSLYIDQEYDMAVKERELTESRTAVMLSQIQPHFLFNTLTAIARLCDLDPQKAKKTTLDFSEYLRGNLDSLSQSQPVPFAQELRHMEIYASIEKTRFGDRLDIKYDIEADGFLIPSLTVQPLVENAVKHGVGKRVEGGTVSIATREDDKGWYVVIKDDGVGFDVGQTLDDGRSHIGISSVRSRLAAQCDGTLTIKSEADVGTTAEIFIPKEGIPHGNSCYCEKKHI